MLLFVAIIGIIGSSILVGRGITLGVTALGLSKEYGPILAAGIAIAGASRHETPGSIDEVILISFMLFIASAASLMIIPRARRKKDE